MAQGKYNKNKQQMKTKAMVFKHFINQYQIQLRNF